MQNAPRPTFLRLLGSAGLSVAGAQVAAIPFGLLLALAFGLAYAADEMDASEPLRFASGVFMVAAYLIAVAGPLIAGLVVLREAANRLAGWRPGWPATLLAAGAPGIAAGALVVGALEPTAAEAAAVAVGWAIACALILTSLAARS